MVETTPSNSRNELRRYTTLAPALHVLAADVLTLRSPAGWDDKNDVFVMEQYQARAQLGSVLALCFAGAEETYHHWRVFAAGAEGVCLVFKRAPLLAHFGKNSEVRIRKVQYRTLESLELTPPSNDMLPFTKRYGFHTEQEFRLLHASPHSNLASFPVLTGKELLDRVVLSPWLPETLFDTVERAIKVAAGQQVHVTRSNLINSSEFQRHLGAVGS
jgi:hypothetical protein